MQTSLNTTENKSKKSKSKTELTIDTDLKKSSKESSKESSKTTSKKTTKKNKKVLTNEDDEEDKEIEDDKIEEKIINYEEIYNKKNIDIEESNSKLDDNSIYENIENTDLNEDELNEEDSNDSNDSIHSFKLSEKEELNNDISNIIEKYDLVIHYFESINETNFKNVDFSKQSMTDLSARFKKIMKLYTNLNTNMYDLTVKESLVSLKQKDSKKKKPKKSMNKDNMAINKLHETYPEVIQFLKAEKFIEEDSCVTTTSRLQLLQAINGSVKKEKDLNNPNIIVEGNNKKFYLIGNLKVIFDFIVLKMVEKEELEDTSKFPSNISYTDIFKYLKYFVKH